MRRRKAEAAAHKDGAEQLRQEADKRVGRNSKKLADLLMTKALAGDLASTKVLFGLAEHKKPIQELVKNDYGLTMAERLAAEPQWEGGED
jgi:hypothetical protein